MSGTDLEAQQAVARRWIRQACLWSWPVCIGVTFCLLAGFIPPPDPSWSADEFAQFFADDRTLIRAGLLGAMFFSALLLPYMTLISQEMKRIEGRDALLAPIQYGGAVMLTLIFQIICLFWLLASFRAEVEPNTVRGFTEFGWFCWSMYIPVYMIQFLCMAFAGFMDKREKPLWPRWAAWFNLWVAVIGAGGVLAVFFKEGPFAYNGLVGFWLPALIFVAGMTMTFELMRRRFSAV
jgi:hypothetical protein